MTSCALNTDSGVGDKVLTELVKQVANTIIAYDEKVQESTCAGTNSTLQVALLAARQISDLHYTELTWSKVGIMGRCFKLQYTFSHYNERTLVR